MPIKKHDRVYHRKLDEDGVVTEVLGNGRYRVGIGGLHVECREQDLLLRKDGPTAHAKTPGPVRSSTKEGKSTTKGPRPTASVDLHGMTVEEALARVTAAIDDALTGGADALSIVHGHGTGRVKAAVHRHLKALPVVKRFRVDEKNTGVTWAYF